MINDKQLAEFQDNW